MITNLELPKTVPLTMRSVASPQKLEQMNPPYHEEVIMNRIQSSATTQEHFALGDFDSTLSIARDSKLPPFRQKLVLVVLVIEMFRRGQFEGARELLAELESRGLGAWDRITLALGFVGREPWGGYPYPDW
jgi:hypothetical protein